MMATTEDFVSTTAADPGPLQPTRPDVWRRQAPKKVRHAYRDLSAEEAWSTWVDYLHEREKPAPLAKLLPGKRNPLFWNAPQGVSAAAAAADADSGQSELFVCLAKLPKRKRGGSELDEQLAAWLGEAAGEVSSAAASVVGAYEALAVAYALPKLARHLDRELWWELLEHLRRTAIEAAGLSLDAQPLAAQLLAGELALALAYLFPELEPCSDLWPLGRRQLSLGLEELLDGEGLPHARFVALTRSLLACWTRAQALGIGQRERPFNDEGETQYEWLVRRTLQLARRDGTQAFATGTAGAWEPELIAAAIRFGGNAEDTAAATVSLPGRRRKEVKRVKPAELPKCADHSEWAALAILRTGWQRDDTRLFVKYDRPEIELELDGRRGLVFAGPWQLELSLAGQPLAAPASWEQVCWESYDEVDYLELEGEFTSPEGDEVRVQRQLLLAREDGFAYLADVILGPGSGELQYAARLPLAAGVEFVPAAETREGLLRAEKDVARVMPLALPEWRIDPRGGTLAGAAGSLELRQRTTARNLYCPLFIDLYPSRLRREATWRQLTVAENREIVPAEVAAGYRVQSAEEQWIFYRSLGRKGNRTLLAQNLVSEFLAAARFDYEGNVDGLIEVD